jgi:hypothetical protein
MTCETCGKFVETEQDFSYSTGRVMAVPVEGVSIRCEGCGGFVHVHVACATGDFCRACSQIDPIPMGLPVC